MDGTGGQDKEAAAGGWAGFSRSIGRVRPSKGSACALARLPAQSSFTSSWLAPASACTVGQRATQRRKYSAARDT